MPISVVHRFELIQVEKRNTERLPILDFPFQPTFQVKPVRQAGEWVAQREFFRLLQPVLVSRDFRLQLSQRLLAVLLHLVNASLQLARSLHQR